MFKNKVFEINEINFISYLIIKEDRNRIAKQQLLNTRTNKILAAKESATDYINEIVSWIADELAETPLIIIPFPSTDKDKDINKQLPNIITAAVHARHRGWIDGSGYLVRKHSLPKNTRDKVKQYESLTIKNKGVLRDKDILLLDDVTTSGSSLLAGLKILAEDKPRKLKALAIAKKVYLKNIPLSGIY